MKVFLDDLRPAPAGWTLVKTPKEAIDLLKTGKVTELSLDHDLGDDENIGTGYDVLLWIEEQVYLHNFVPPKIIKIHSANSGARTKMELAIKNIYKKVNLGETTMKYSKLRSIIKEEIINVLNEADEVEFGDEPYGRKHVSPSYLFTVENDEDGRERIQRVKNDLGDIFTFRVRGRHHDRKEALGSKYQPGAQNDIPLQQAEYLAVYADPKR